MENKIDYDELRYSSEYGEFLMDNAASEGLIICNGDMLLEYMERGVLFDRFCSEAGIPVEV